MGGPHCQLANSARLREVCPLPCPVVWRCSSFLIKRKKKTPSTQPDNPKAHNSFCYNRLVSPQDCGHGWARVGTELLTKGMVQRRSGQRNPATSSVRTAVNKNARATLSSTRHTTRKSKYRPDVYMAARSLCW
ncbi:60S ribosomal protein L28-like [Leopardus geoffroyi]|uniref:60S ribosomal protein L28-like n=1 Tax=Leopardus geoffroyi TaxID=46844 RepID=UPI001E260E79|nr:60S ribosomal protein L28-like [Leopardus geoffroyi]